MENYTGYAAILIAVLTFFKSNREFTTPEELEKAKAEILEKAENKFVTLKQFDEMKNSLENQYKDIKADIKEVFDILRGIKE